MVPLILEPSVLGPRVPGAAIGHWCSQPLPTGRSPMHGLGGDSRQHREGPWEHCGRCDDGMSTRAVCHLELPRDVPASELDLEAFPALTWGNIASWMLQRSPAGRRHIVQNIRAKHRGAR